MMKKQRQDEKKGKNQENEKKRKKEKIFLNSHTFTYLYAANKSFADTVANSRQTSYMKSLQLQSWEVRTDFH